MAHQFDDDFIQPVPQSEEFSDRFVSGRSNEPLAFEEVLKNPQGDDHRRVRDKHEMRNFRWLYVVSGILLVGLISRSGFLQIAQGERYRGLAEGNRLRALVLSAPRGILYDRNLEQLVENVPSYDLVMVPVDIPTDEQKRSDLFAKLSTEFGVSSQELIEVYDSNDHALFDPIIVAKDIPRDSALILQANVANYPGVRADVSAVREYKSAVALSHVVGYVGRLTAEEVADHQDYELTDQLGKAGLENSHESNLRGKNGAQNVEVDAHGQIVAVLATEQPRAGSDLVLGIDAGLQNVLYQELSKAADRSKKLRAAAVAIDPRNGEILALVSVPGYDVNEFGRGIKPEKLDQLVNDPNQPLFSRPLSGTYPPGSTFKPFVATGALQAGTITESTTYVDTGSIVIGGQTFRSWKAGGHGEVNVVQAIANSVNTFFYSIGGGFGEIDGLGINGIDRIAQAFGFGSPSGIDLPGEAKGLLPTPEWKEENYNEQWFLGDTYNAAIGQGFVLATPLQLANATAAVANGGTLYWPHLVKKIIKADGTEEDIPSRTLTERVADAGIIDIVRRGMRATVAGGTGRLLNDLPVKVAGKTGTAQFGTKEPNAWFIAFAPYDEPTIAIAVLVEQAGEGSDFSAPVAKEALKYFFSRATTKE